jgi:hypothetical protein
MTTFVSGEMDSDFAEHIQATLPGHFEIEDRSVGFEISGLIDRGIKTFGNVNNPATFGKSFFQPVPQDIVVVDDED